MTSKTNLELTFPSNQYIIEGNAQPRTLDKNGKEGEIFLFIWEDIPRRLLTTSLPKDFE